MVAVLMATHNGGKWIGRTLESLANMNATPFGWKLVVINNGSTDATAEIVGSFHDRLPLQLLHSPKPGKNAALNLALDHFEGELAVFTDDDVIVEPNWLLNLTQAAADEPEYAIFGGAIRPEWPQAPARWMVDWVPHGVTWTVTPPMPRGACAPDAVWGPNMAVRRELFRGGLRFDERIGPNGSNTYPMGSETSFTRRVAALGVRCFHVPEAVVGHIIRPMQMTRDFVLGRAYRAGRGKGILAQELEPAPAVANVPRYFLRQAAQAGLRFGSAALLRDQAAAFRAAWRWNYALGCISGARAAAVSAAPIRSLPSFAGVPSQQAPRPA